MYSNTDLIYLSAFFCLIINHITRYQKVLSLSNYKELKMNQKKIAEILTDKCKDIDYPREKLDMESICNGIYEEGDKGGNQFGRMH